MKKKISFSEFDAELNTDVCDTYENMDLTLTLRLGFQQINPADGKAAGTYHDYGDSTETARKIVKWTPGTWAQWKTNFVTTAQAFWTDKFWLVNKTALFAFEKKGLVLIPNADCRIRIIAQDATAANNHHTIDVVRLNSSENFFGSHSTLYDSLDITPVHKANDSAGKKIMQRAHVHEVGHLLGLGHVDEGKAHCPKTGNTNSRACYGVTDVDKNSVMGSGMQLRQGHAAPWQRAMASFAFREAVSAASPAMPVPGIGATIGLAKGVAAGLEKWDAKTMKVYPRTPEEVAKGTMLNATPMRS